jgi:hypothetical protein
VNRFKRRWDEEVDDGFVVAGGSWRVVAVACCKVVCFLVSRVEG